MPFDWIARRTIQMCFAVIAIAYAPFAAAQPVTQPISLNANDLAKSYNAFDVLEVCQRTNIGDVSADELAGYGKVLKRIVDHARRVELNLDERALHALLPINVQTGIAGPWVCDAARLSLSRSLWRRYTAKDYDERGAATGRLFLLDDFLRKQACNLSEPCVTSLVPQLAIRGFFALSHPYCRTHERECDEAETGRNRNVPITRCDLAASQQKCDRERLEQGERFKKG